MEGYSIIQRKKKERESKRRRRRRRRMVMMRRRKLKMDRTPRWDFPSLIGAYVSLGIAFLLLCCSSLAFLADKFLALFGLSLPCPQFNAYLVQTPVAMISRVDTLASRRPPFYSDALTMDEEDDEEEEEEEEEEPEEEEEEEEEEEQKVEGDEDGDQNLYISNHPYGTGEGEDPWNTPLSGYHSDVPQESVDRSDAETVEILRQALMKEKAAQHALQNDLEKERTYAASAADEAVAMILRVQKEKAIVEMNAKQYRRMVEEKAAYDEDEKEILKEILITMEKEVYFLRKQLNPEADDCADEEEYYSEIQEKGVVSVDVYSSHAQQQQQQQSQTNLEIENLRQKLVVVHQGREQFNLAVQEMEEEDDGFQSQLLKEIGCQLQIIRRRFSAPTAPCKSRNRPKKKRRHGFPHLGVSGTS